MAFELNGRIGNITVSDDSVKVVMEFPNDARTTDELDFLWPIKRRLCVIHVEQAPNVEYVCGPKRSEKDEVGTESFPWANKVICYGCEKELDTAKDEYFVNADIKKFLCKGCKRKPLPETTITMTDPNTGESVSAPIEKVGAALKKKAAGK